MVGFLLMENEMGVWVSIQCKKLVTKALDYGVSEKRRER